MGNERELSENHQHEHSHHHHGHHHHHSHEHTHGNGHDHHHEHDASETPKAVHLLKYMLDHNIHHVEELEKVIGSLEADGLMDAAAAAKDALESYKQGNDRLAHAIDHV